MSCKHHNVTPAQLLEIAGRFADQPGTCLLFSGGSTALSGRSYLCLFPQETLCIPASADPWEALRAKIGTGVKCGPDIPAWVGYLSYEMGAFSDREKPLTHALPAEPYAYFYRPSVVLALDHASGELDIHADQPFEFDLDLFGVSETPSISLSLKRDFEPFELYAKKIERIKSHIVDGDIYQANLSQKILFSGVKSPSALFRQLVKRNPTPYMAYLRYPEFSILSNSPEQFIRKTGRRLETRPIKGTAPRGKTVAEDKQNRALLLASPKERAELLMITDLMRNDLGRISVPGSVLTEQIWHCEEYPNVFHLNSTISSQVLEGIDSVEMMRVLFPAGSITGCPKLRAIEILHEIEQRPRGVYTGAIGYFAESGDFHFNVAIRTLLCRDDTIELSVGGGIVFDSDPRKEYEEILHKAAPFLRHR